MQQMKQDDEPRVLITKDGPVATLRLNRPSARNALDLEMVNAMHAALDQLTADSGLACLIVTGTGEQAFVAGADIAQLRERRSSDAFQRINQALFRKVEDFPAPTIAAVRGWALGGGCELAMSCDIRIAGESARFGQPEVGLGIIPGAGATHRLQRLVGVARARELIFTGDLIDAAEAHRIGLVNRVVKDDAVLEAAQALALRIAKNSLGAVRLSKLAVSCAPDLSDRGRDVVETLAQAICFESADKFERMTAFLERRKG